MAVSNLKVHVNLSQIQADATRYYLHTMIRYLGFSFICTVIREKLQGGVVCTLV